MTAKAGFRPVVLCVLDGWGHRAETENNAIALADTPVWDRLAAARPHGLLAASGSAVGLPDGQMGNSEVGHMTIGAGRVIPQDLPRIDAAVADGSLACNPVLLSLIERLRQTGGRCHLMGLLSPGGVHAHMRHMAALAGALGGAGVPVEVHAFLDGRDTPPRSALGCLEAFEQTLRDMPGARIGTVAGRYFAMDRDRRWQRTARAVETMIAGAGARADSAAAAVRASYEKGAGDEFVEPIAIGGYGGMADGDGLVMANFRADRARQCLSALLDPAFEGFARPRVPRFAAAVGMSVYSDALDSLMDSLFRPLRVADGLGETVSRAGLRQFRIAETEKYAHVTFFLNGGEERTFAGEERALVPSPPVATYDRQPEMSAPEVTDRAVAAIAGGRFELIVINYANPDMVGHTGDLDAAIAACAAVDRCLGRLEETVEAVGGALLVTADHGNAEVMRSVEDGAPQTAHSENPVPAVLVGASGLGLADGGLADVAPTLLALMGLDAPGAMTGRSLLCDMAPGASWIARETAGRALPQ